MGALTILGIAGLIGLGCLGSGPKLSRLALPAASLLVVRASDGRNDLDAANTTNFLLRPGWHTFSPGLPKRVSRLHEFSSGESQGKSYDSELFGSPTAA